MLKHLHILILVLVISSCSSGDVYMEESSKKSPEIRLYNENIGWETKVRCKIVYQGETFFGRVKFRGGMSSRYDKHSMTIEFNKEKSIAGLPKNDDWILNASYIDKTFQRHKLSFDLFRSMSVKNKAPRCAYIPVYINDNYQGLYVVMEKVNGSWLNFDRSDPEKAMLFKDALVFKDGKLAEAQEPDNYYQQKFPKIYEIDYTSRLDRFKKFLFESEDLEFEKSIGKWVDLKSVVDWQLLLMFTNNDDGLYKNFYLYSEKDSKRFKFIPWDYDHSFGRDGDYELNLIDRELGWERMILFKRLMKCENIGYPQMLKSRWEELRKEVFTERNLYRMIDENHQAVKPFVKENTERWPMNSKWYSDENTYEEEMDILRKYVPMRLKQLDDFFHTL